jgi:hypothetical protein
MFTTAVVDTFVPVTVPTTAYAPLVGPAVNVPSLAMVPPVADQVTVLPVGAPDSVALNCCCPPGASPALVGETVMVSVEVVVVTTRRPLGTFGAFFVWASNEDEPLADPMSRSAINVTTPRRRAGTEAEPVMVRLPLGVRKRE